MNSFEEPKTPNNNNTNKNTHKKSTIFTTPKWPSSRRSNSLSSSPSISSNSSSSFRSFTNEDSPPPSPSPPQRIPFSWETIPGIPKHNQIIKRINSPRNNNNNSNNSFTYLPLPPAADAPPKPNNGKKNHILRSHHNDPFFVALVQCSKSGDAEEDSINIEDKDMFGSFFKGPVKGLSHRFGFVNFSCKNNTSCSVTESLVFLPREQPRRISYGLVKKRSG